MTRPNLRVTPPDDEPAPEPVGNLWESAKNVKKQPITWLLPGRILNGSLAILEGAKGVSKSTFSCALAAAITTGRAFLGRRKTKASSVIWLPGEEDVSTMVRPRLESAGANIDRVHFPRLNDRGERQRLSLPGSVPQLRDAIQHFKAGLVVIDPLSSHVPADLNLHVDQVIHQILDPVADLAFAMGCVILLTRNLTKDKFAARINQGLGGAAVGGVARSVLVIDWPDRKIMRRVLRVVACNMAPNTPAVEYGLEDKKGWPILTGVREIPFDQDDEEIDSLSTDEKDESADAETLIRRLIKTERVPYSTIWSEAQGAGIGLRTLRKTKVRLGVKSYRVGTSTPPHWEWGPPLGGW